MDTDTNSQKNNFSYIGFQYYSLTWSCYERQRLFTQRDRVDLVRSQFLRASRETNVVDIAHCFMPDHVHELVQGMTATADAEEYIRKAKQYSGFYFKKAFTMKLWRRKGFKVVLLDDYAPREIVKYIIESPVKAGLVKRVEDYPFTGSSQHTIKELMRIAYMM